MLIPFVDMDVNISNNITLTDCPVVDFFPTIQQCLPDELSFANNGWLYCFKMNKRNDMCWCQVAHIGSSA